MRMFCTKKKFKLVKARKVSPTYAWSFEQGADLCNNKDYLVNSIFSLACSSCCSVCSMASVVSGSCSSNICCGGSYSCPSCGKCCSSHWNNGVHWTCDVYTGCCSPLYDCSQIWELGMTITSCGVQDNDISDLMPYICQYGS